MLIAGPLAYLELPRTGCTHTGMLLRSLFAAADVGPKHNRLPDALRPHVRFIVGSMRNPWDWYVSLWSFGCEGNGALYHQLTSPADDGPRAASWRETYADVEDGGRFRAWLQALHDPASRADVGERFAESPISRTSGLLTYRYAYLYADAVDDLYTEAVASPTGIHALLQRNLLDYTIRTEQLASDLARTLDACGFALSAAQLASIFSAPRTNVSNRRPAAHYYDRATCDLVAARDRFLIEDYGYSAPDSIS